MRWQTTTALAVALLLVGGFYYVYEVRWAPYRERAETRKGRVFSAEATDVTGVELKRREDTVRLTRAGEAWELKSPVVARAERGRPGPAAGGAASRHRGGRRDVREAAGGEGEGVRGRGAALARDLRARPAAPADDPHGEGQGAGESHAARRPH